MKADEIPENSRLLASDDVFDAMLDTRAFNDGMDQERKAVFQEYLANKHSHFQLSSMADYEQLRLVNSARHKTQSRYVREELGIDVYKRQITFIRLGAVKRAAIRSSYFS